MQKQDANWNWKSQYRNLSNQFWGLITQPKFTSMSPSLFIYIWLAKRLCLTTKLSKENNYDTAFNQRHPGTKRRKSTPSGYHL